LTVAASLSVGLHGPLSERGKKLINAIVTRRATSRGALTTMNGHPRVLIVDDDADTLRLYGFALGMMGCEVISAESAREALRAAVRTSPDVVVTDLAMPGMDGIELCRKLRSAPDTRDLPVVAVSGQAVGKDGERARAAGFTEVLLKPCSPEELYASVSRLRRDRVAEGSWAPRESEEREVTR
jgi:CheY-like chemotaxis protein